jgi:hypothetical protein
VINEDKEGKDGKEDIMVKVDKKKLSVMESFLL